MEVYWRCSYQQQMGIFLLLNVTVSWRSPRQWGRVRASFHHLCLVPECLDFFSLLNDQESLPGHLGQGVLGQKGVHPRRMFHCSPRGKCKPSGLCFLQCNSMFCPVRGHQVPSISANPLWCKAVRVQFWDPTPALAFIWVFQHFVTLEVTVKSIKLSREILQIPNSLFAEIKQRPEDIKSSVIPAT